MPIIINKNTNYTLNPDITFLEYKSGNKASLFRRTDKKYFTINKVGILIIKAILSNIPLEKVLEKLPNEGKEYLNGLITSEIITEGSPKDYPFSLRKVKIPLQISNLQIEITRKCNLRCLHCYTEAGPDIDETLNSIDLLKIIDEAKDAGVSQIDLTGGEALMHPDIFYILEYIIKNGMETVLFTNGTLLNERKLKKLQEIGVQDLWISVDGATSETHDNFRQVKGAFDLTMKNILKARELGIPFKVSITMSKENYQEIDILVNKLKELNIRYSVDTFVPFGRGEDNKEQIVLGKKYISVVKDTIKRETEKLGPQKPSERDFFCGAGNSYLFIAANGDVKLCPTLPFVAGNVKRQSLIDIWLNNKVSNDYRNMNCKFVDECVYGNVCKGGCRSRAYLLYGEIDKPDLQSCNLFKDLYGETPPSLLKKNRGNVEINAGS